MTHATDFSTLPHEFAINAAERTHDNNARIWAAAPDAPCEDDPQVAALYDMAWQMFREGDIDDACCNDLIDIVFR